MVGALNGDVTGMQGGDWRGGVTRPREELAWQSPRRQELMGQGGGRGVREGGREGQAVAGPQHSRLLFVVLKMAWAVPSP